MAKNTDAKLNIQEAIQAFAKDDISKAGINLFSILGYDTSLQAQLDKKTFAEFKEDYIEASPAADRFNEEKALTDEWKTIDILFQLTDESFTGQQQLFDSKLDPLNPQSYLCFAIELKGDEYSKTQIAGITREVNKLFSIPIIIVFKYGKCITLAIINRRVNKRDSDRDVLEKVTLIKDIFYEKPHRAHIEILFDMSLAQLSADYTITNFESLHKAWSEVLDTQTLNKRFYTELSNWYFWAIKTVVYPGYEMEAARGTLFTKEEKLREHNAKNLIRLLTRLLFVWFIKEKDLIPEELFDEKLIKEIITKFEPEKQYDFSEIQPESKSIYYKAILQNLFFASLNAEHGKRAFRIDGQNQNATSLMRYQRYHKNPEAFVQLIESKVPFMNGGLFECLDHQDDELKGKKGGAVIDYEDGFSDRKDNELFVPDYVFFGKDVKVDLSTEYDDKKKKDVTVNGIINILQKYKFTIAENTPVEEDIALDPELLGRVFENLLASYNPETKTNARKQTGSFYTPRPIVEYMVDESLKAYLKTKIKDAALSKGTLEEKTKAVEELENTLDSKLDNLIAYNETEPEFTEEERFQILKYIDECKILDPACGSGAFPMGILQKMVYVIHKLDPQNDNWKQIQIQKISNDTKLTPKEKNELQKELLTVFDDNELDYARKLYLIENCIHGIDIQPIATQISRLRFFISLIVDQKVDNNKANFGIRPLPNLENRFVTANSLIGLNDETATLFDKDIEPLMERLQKVRHNLFNAKSPKYKFELKQEDKQIRQELEQTLMDLGFGKENAKLISTWDPYDKNRSAEYFDAEWMFGIKDGFDIVIGNPPYVNVANIKPDSYRKKLQQLYYSARNKSDLYSFFIENGFKLLKTKGLQSYIVPHTWKATDSFKNLREIIFTKHKMLKVVNQKMGVFDAVVNPMIILLSNVYEDNYQIDVYDGIGNFKYKLNVKEIKNDPNFAINSESSMEEKEIFKKIEKANLRLSDIISFSRGIKTSDDKRFISNECKSKEYKKVYRGRNIKAYEMNWANEYIWYRPDLMREKVGCLPHTKEFFEVPEKLITQRVNSSMQLLVAYDDKQNYFLDTTNVSNYKTWNKSFSLKFLCGILNSRVINYWYPRKYRMPTIGGYELGSIPIPQATVEQQKPVIELVDKILTAKKANPQADTSKEEAEIDRLVYALYGLSEDEIKIVEEK
ncbi:MAG: N-6 DNA methylase [Treponema sp.]|nr:N-6 DNA methylase [Treponema sp.]